ncbi:hypothetical protein THRCLA_03375 [Thraustotheca clavata]|uniref:Uncharacterized protein n=1 Tax=Thraustotheca clavata TaxID=74557 RepID=A0A1W0A299_9STRA|nr:hypothetical protein THRCLA_03375 [Thraustotheca clavata]
MQARSCADGGKVDEKREKKAPLASKLNPNASVFTFTPSSTRKQANKQASSATDEARRSHVLKDGKRTAIGRRKKPKATSSAVVGPSTMPIPTQIKKTKKKTKRKLQILRRPRSDSNGGSSSESEDDEAYPVKATSKSSAFTDKLAFALPQKRIPKRVTREAVVDTVFSALFANKLNIDSGSESDTPNEQFVKNGLTSILFSNGVTLNLSDASAEVTMDQYITPIFIHRLITEMRFEDFRTSSARLHILRAIHKHLPHRRGHISRAIADATFLRLEYLESLEKMAKKQCREMSVVAMDMSMANLSANSKSAKVKNFDHGHSWTEFLRYAIEHIGKDDESEDILKNYARAWIHLMRSHYIDTTGSDEDELVTAGGQFVAYVPSMAGELLKRLLHTWPRRQPGNQAMAIRTAARILLSAPRYDGVLVHQLFKLLIKCMQEPHVTVAKEALSFTGCQFVMMNYVQLNQDLYTLLSSGFLKVMKCHWNGSIKALGARYFDTILDYSP